MTENCIENYKEIGEKEGNLQKKMIVKRLAKK